MDNNNIYYSKIDTWLVLILLLPLDLGLLSILEYGLEKKYFITAFSIAFSYFICWIFCFPCKYILDKNELIIKSGVITYKIEYAQITSVKKSSSLWGAPALSLKRVKINYAENKMVLVSPKNRDFFIDKLNEKVKQSKLN